MKVRVLGCSGAIAKDCRTTSFLIDGDILIDAGTGVGDLTLDEMRNGIDHVFLTHSHLDHVAALPLMVDAVAARRDKPLQIHALAGTIAALKAHIFNDVIWPDFSRIPTPQAPVHQFPRDPDRPDAADQPQAARGAAGRAHRAGGGLRDHGGHGCWVFSGDTERNPAFWEACQPAQCGHAGHRDRVQQPREGPGQAQPAPLAHGAGPGAGLHRQDAEPFPIYITHTKPAETDLIMAEIQKFDQTSVSGPNVTHDIRWLRAGQEFDL
jgi:hypothetical protein